MTDERKKAQSPYESAIDVEKRKTIYIISHIDNPWIVHQIHRTLVNITKGTIYECLAYEEGGTDR